MSTTLEMQPRLANELIRLQPLATEDFAALYAIAADPLIWEQHPSRNRYQEDVFRTYFKGAVESGGAFLVIDNKTQRPIGSSRYYDLDAQLRRVAIGYTFIARDYWGRNYNRALKTLMLDHAFRVLERVVFHVGENNLRSRRAMEKLGGVLIGQASISYYGESNHQNVIYQIEKKDWVGAAE